MKIRDIAPKFSVSVFANDIDHGAGIKVALTQAGYDAFFFEDRDRLLSRIAEKAPHVLIFSTASTKSGLSDFIESILKINAEIRFIAIAKASQIEVLSSYNEYGLVDVLTDEPEGLAARAVFAVDRACEKLYLTYQNEQLIDRLDADRAKLAEAQQAATGASEAAARRGPPIEDRIKDYRSAAAKEDLLRRFMQIAGKTPCVFLKYLPTVRSLVLTHSTTFDADGAQSVGCQLEAAEAKDFGSQVALGVVVPSLDRLLREAFRFPQSRLLPLFVHGQLEGVFAHDASLAGAERDRLHDEYALLALAYSNFALEKRVDALEVIDPVTEIQNRKAYTAKLQEEWARARRIRQPLCVVKLALDDFFELEQTLGENVRDTLLRQLAQLVLRTSRTNDTSCRTGLNEFAMILPHCSREGAMIRAERLRRIVENSQMLENGLKISVSLGISEYPGLCSTAQSLDETSTRALVHIMDKGGNRLCLFKAPADHRPDFPVTPTAVEQGS